MAGRPYEKLSHSCGTREGLQVFIQEDGSVDGYCFACGKSVPDPYGDKVEEKDLKPLPVLTPEERQEKLDEITNLPTVELTSRKLRKQYLDEFGVRVSLSEYDGKTPTVIHYPYYKEGVLVGYKNKVIKTKQMWSTGNTKQVDMFGWERAKKSSSKRLIITEGEDDAVAVRSILARYTPEQYKKIMPAVVSIPHGASTAAVDIDRMKEQITRRFKEVVLCFDDDDAGKLAIDKVMLVLPNAMVATLPAKDANECIIKNLSEEAYKALSFNVAKPKNTRLVFGRDIHDAARKPAERGELSWPWPTLDNLTRGIRYGETTFIGAGVKMGKSELLNALAAHFIQAHKVPVFMAKPEESNNKTYKLLAGKIVGKVFHDPNVEFDFEAYDKAGKVLDDKLIMVNLYQHMGWDTLKADIISSAQLGAKVVFIDPITNLTNGINAGDANTALQGIAQDLAGMALDLNIHIFIFCHLKAHEGNITKEKRESAYREGKTIGLGNCPHELGGDVLSTQFAGSRAMMRSCNYMLGLEGNKDESLDEVQRSVRHLKLLEDREFGEVGKAKLYWSRDTTLFKEV